MSPSSPDRVGIGLLGASSIAPQAIVEPSRRRPGVDVVSVGARRPGAAEAFSARWGIPRAETSYQAVVDDPAIDAVYVSLAASDHARWAVAALEAGKDVLCEKPATTSLIDARAMSRAAEASGRLLIEAFHYRWHPLFARLRALVATDDFGPVVSMSSSIIGRRSFAADSVLHNPALGGGALRHSGCYAIHWMRTIVGDEPRVAEFELVPNPLGADASSSLALAFPGGERGLIASAFDRDRDADDPPDLVVESATNRIEVDGLIVPHHGHEVWWYRAGEIVEQFTVAGRTSYDHQLDAFLSARNDAGAARDHREDLVAQATVLDAAYAAAR